MKHNFSLVTVLGIFAIIFVVINHTEGSKKVESTWKKFSTVATTSSYSKKIVYMNAGIDAARTMDYGRKLEPIIEERNRILRENGFVAVGKWWVTEGIDGVVEPTEGCLYLFVGKW